MTPPLSSVAGKPVIVRVKRKASQAKLDAFLSFFLCVCTQGWRSMKGHIKKHSWILEISPFLIVAREKQTSGNSKEFKGRSKERRSLYKADKKHDQLRSKAIKEHEDLARSARFEQIWKKRGSINAEECSLHEKCHLYNVIRVDAEDERVAKSKGALEVDGPIFDKYLPLLKEFLPQAAKEIEHDKATKEDKFVYDIYTVGVGVDTNTDNTDEYPLVQVYVEDDYYDGPSQSDFDYESDDSNAENNPWNDYRDEESSEDEDENESPFTDSENSNSDYDQEIDSEEEDRENWRWIYR